MISNSTDSPAPKWSLPSARQALTNLVCDGYAHLATKFLDHAARHRVQLHGPVMLEALPFWPTPTREVFDRFYANLEELTRRGERQNHEEN